MSFSPDPGGIELRLLGSVSPRLVNAAYPMEALTKWHSAHHVPGLTGRWMDTGGTALGGAVRGPFHRLAHGHHLFLDGFKVLVNPDLSFGQFLHHIGLDILTKSGIPNPLLPKSLAEKLIGVGLEPALVREFMTINLPKLLGGNLAILCSGCDVFLAFSDVIPHTFMAAGVHFALGTLDLAFGLFPANILMLTAGAGEFVAGTMTAYRAWVDPIIPALGVPMSVYLPVLGHVVALASILAGCTWILSGEGFQTLPKMLIPSVAAAASATTAALMAKVGGMTSPFLGPAAGIVTALILRKLIRTCRPVPRQVLLEQMKSPWEAHYFASDLAIPLLRLPRAPLGHLAGETLNLEPSGAIIA